jgi:hypothetical protein
MASENWIENDVEESSRGQFEALWPYLLWVTEENHGKTQSG